MTENKISLGLVHTSATLVPIFQDLCQTYLKGVDVFNIVDDSLIKDVIRRGELAPATGRRVINHIGAAEAAGADYIMVTCSSIGAAVEAAAPWTKVPVMRVDQPMADLAINTGNKIGVIATLPTTLSPTSDLVNRRAKALSKDISLTSKLCEGAFEALMSGDATTHDRMISEALKELSDEVEVILLAQASMARVVDMLDESAKKIPIIPSPPVAVKFLARVLNKK